MEAMLDGLNAAITMPAAPVYPTADREDYVAAMRNAATSVTVVTTDGPSGRFGLTVSAMASVSAEPPMLLVCVNGASPAAAAIAANRVFCVSLLGEDHVPVSDVFAGRLKAVDRFAGAGCWDELATGAPALADAPAVFDCRVVETHPFGTHRMFVGLVVAVRAGIGAPLVYHDRAYCRAARVS